MSLHRIKFIVILSIVSGASFWISESKAEGPAPTPTPREKVADGTQVKTDYKAKEKLEKTLKGNPDSIDPLGKDEDDPARTKKKIDNDLDVRTDYKAAENFLEKMNSGLSKNEKDAHDTCKKIGKLISVYNVDENKAFCLPKSDVSDENKWTVSGFTKNNTIHVHNLGRNDSFILFDGDVCENLKGLDITDRKVLAENYLSVDYEKSFKVLYGAPATSCMNANSAGNTNKDKDSYEEEYRKRQETISPSNQEQKKKKKLENKSIQDN